MPFRVVFPFYLAYLLLFPAGMYWVESHELTGPTVCGFRQHTGLECPGCGMTRAFRAMGRLDMAGAFRYNPLGPAFFAVAVLLWLYMAAATVTRGRVRLPYWFRRWQFHLLWTGLIVYLALGFGRMYLQYRHPELRHPSTPMPGVAAPAGRHSAPASEGN